MPQAETNTTPLQSKKFYRFTGQGCDLGTRLAFEDWATVPMIRVVKFLLAGSDTVFNYKVIATMIGTSVGTAHAAIKTLIQKGYLKAENGKFCVSVGSVQKTERDVQKSEHIQNPELKVQKTENFFQDSETDSNCLKERSKRIGEALFFQSEFDREDIRTWTHKYQERLRGKGRDLDQIGLDALFMRYHGKPDRFLAALVHTCSLSGALNLYDPPEPKTTKILQAVASVRKEYVPPWLNDRPPDPKEVEEARAKIKAIVKNEFKKDATTNT